MPGFETLPVDPDMVLMRACRTSAQGGIAVTASADTDLVLVLQTHDGVDCHELELTAALATALAHELLAAAALLGARPTGEMH